MTREKHTKAIATCVIGRLCRNEKYKWDGAWPPPLVFNWGATYFDASSVIGGEGSVDFQCSAGSFSAIFDSPEVFAVIQLVEMEMW